MTVLATHQSADRDMAPFDTSLQLAESEPLGVGIKRVTMEQLEHAASGFFDGEVEYGSAIHEARKSIKRVRALLRLVRGELPKRIFGFENSSLRETARIISDIRAARGVLDAALSIVDLYGDLLAQGTFDELVSRLQHRREVTELRALEDPNLVGRVVRSLERTYHRYEGWPTDPDAIEVYGVGIRDSYEAVGPGLSRTYTKGRNNMVHAYRRTDPHGFHEWRKRVKDLRHQMEFLAPLWPEVVVGTAMTLERLGDVLGEDHDLAELVSLLDARPDMCPSPRERSLFRALAQQRRSELQTAGEILGRRVYAEPPDALNHRYGEYWEAWKLASARSLDTIVVY